MVSSLLVTTTRTGKLAQAASTALAKLAGEPQPNVVQELEPAGPAAEVVPPAQITRARAAELRKAWRKAEQRAEDAREALDAAKAAILAEMGAADVLQVIETGKAFAEHKAVTSLRFDQTTFRAEHPDQAAGYMKPQTSRRFRVLT